MGRRRRWWAWTAADDEFGAAALVDPEAATVDTPGVVADACRAADLAYELRVTGATDVAPVSAAVVGGAGNARTAATWLECGGGGRRSRRNAGCSDCNARDQEQFRYPCHLASFENAECGWYQAR